jgi:tungstate transport system permease protein
VQDFLQAARSALALVGSLDPEFIGIVGLSLGVSLSASVIAMLIGAPFGGVLAVVRFRGRQTIIVLANALLGLPPVVIALVHRLAAVLWSEYADLMRIDGLSKAHSILELFVIGRSFLLTAFLAAFGRAIAEVGAIIMVGGNIRGFTRTMTTAIALETGKGELPLALGLGLVLVAISVLVSATAFLLNAWADSR